MNIIALNTNEINQNGYHLNKLTRNKIGFIYTAPINIVPNDCLACDGYVLKIADYKKLYSVIGSSFNNGEETEDEFRIPDYNITGRFLQPSKDVGKIISAGLPQHTHSGTTSSNGAHTHTRGTMNIVGTATAIEGSTGFPRNTAVFTGAFYNSQTLSQAFSVSSGGDGATFAMDASRAWTGETSSNGTHNHTMTTGNASNSAYGKSPTVQPPAHTVHLCIKYR